MNFKILAFLFHIFTISNAKQRFVSITDEKIIPKTKNVNCPALLTPAVIQEIKSHAETANRIIDFVTKGPFKGRTYQELSSLVDQHPIRQSGHQNLENAIDYVMAKMKELKIQNVRGEEVAVTKWVRGEETAELLTPMVKKMRILGLGTSIPTPEEGLTGEVVVVKSFEHLASLPDGDVAGKIVVFNQDWVNYSHGVKIRVFGASKASSRGAIAALIRSVGPFSIYSPHTGQQVYDDNVKKIPAACITLEDADFMQRLQDKGHKLQIFLKMLDANEEPGTSRNVIGEILGGEIPQEYVAITGHIDSWDVGQGALDDGGGAMISLMALAAITALELKPRRTLQTILWTAEETGLLGVKAFAKEHVDILKHFSAIFESDSGTFNPLGLDFYGNEKAGCVVAEILKLTESINTTAFLHSDSPISSDITVFQGNDEFAINAVSLNNANDMYFWYHHTQGDALTILDPDELDRATALWAVSSYVVANLAGKLDSPARFGVAAVHAFDRRRRHGGLEEKL